jgi:predicted ATPase
LELLNALPDTPERTQQELALQIALGAPQVMTKGYAAPEVEKTYARARELCRQVGETPLLFPVLGGLWAFYEVRAEHQTAHELAEQYLSLTQRAHSPARLIWAHSILGQNLLLLGEFARAYDYLKRGIALYDPQKHNPFVSGAVQDPKVTCLFYSAWALWSLGYPDRALQRIQEALTLAQELSHPYSLTYALNFAANLYQFHREPQAVQERAEALIALTSEQGFTRYLALGTIWRGWALAEQGKGEEGITSMQQGLAALQATGSELDRPYLLALLAEAYGKIGQAEEGLSALSKALTLVNKTEERYYNLQRWTAMPSGGHFGAMEEPERLVADIRAFYRSLRR